MEDGSLIPPISRVISLKHYNRENQPEQLVPLLKKPE